MPRSAFQCLAIIAGLTMSPALAQNTEMRRDRVETGVEACPAYDEIQQGILDYLAGVDPDDPEAASSEAPVAIEFILDASGSMAARMGGETKMALAQSALLAALDALEPAHALIGLRAYGFDTSLDHSAAASCPNTELVAGFTLGDASDAGAAASGLSPYGYTPIAASLQAAAGDLAALEARDRLIVLISDGEETCEGDPVAAAAEAAGRGVNLSTFVVGFDLDADQAAQMRAIAEAGGGRYIGAPDGEALAESLSEIAGVAINKAERVMPRCLNPVEGGASHDSAVLIEPGVYTVGELLDIGEYRFYRVESEEGELGVVRGLIQSWRYIGEGEAAVESQPGLGAMAIRIHDRDGADNRGAGVRARNLPGTGITAMHADTDGEGFVFSIGDNYERLAPESLVEITLRPAVDGENGDAGPDRDGADFAELAIGDAQTGHLGLDDEADVWRLSASGAATVEIDFEVEDFRYLVEVYEEGGGRRLARGQDALSFEADGAVRILIRSREPALEPRLSAYRLTAITNE